MVVVPAWAMANFMSSRRMDEVPHCTTDCSGYPCRYGNTAGCYEADIDGEFCGGTVACRGSTYPNPPAQPPPPPHIPGNDGQAGAGLLPYDPFVLSVGVGVGVGAPALVLLAPFAYRVSRKRGPPTDCVATCLAGAKAKWGARTNRIVDCLTCAKAFDADPNDVPRHATAARRLAAAALALLLGSTIGVSLVSASYCYYFECMVSSFAIIPLQGIAFVLGAIGTLLQLRFTPSSSRSCCKCWGSCDVLGASSTLNMVAIFFVVINIALTIAVHGAISMPIAAAAVLAAVQLLLITLLVALVTVNARLQDGLRKIAPTPQAARGASGANPRVEPTPGSDTRQAGADEC